MKSKFFLYFSCLVFLISLIYFAFVTIRGKTYARHEQRSSKISANLNEDYRYAKTIAPRPRQDELSGLTDAELEAAIKLFDALDAESGAVENHRHKIHNLRFPSSTPSKTRTLRTESILI